MPERDPDRISFFGEQILPFRLTLGMDEEQVLVRYPAFIGTRPVTTMPRKRDLQPVAPGATERINP